MTRAEIFLYLNQIIIALALGQTEQPEACLSLFDFSIISAPLYSIVIRGALYHVSIANIICWLFKLLRYQGYFHHAHHNFRF